MIITQENMSLTKFHIPVRNHQNFKSKVLTQIQKACSEHYFPAPTFQKIDKKDNSIVCNFPKITVKGMEFKGIIGRKAGHVFMLGSQYGDNYDTHLSRESDKCCECNEYHGNDSYIVFNDNDGNKIMSGECLKKIIRETGDINARLIIAINIIIKKLPDGYLTHRYTLKTYMSRICAIANNNGFKTLDSKDGLPTVVLADYLFIEKKILKSYYEIAEKVIEVGSKSLRNSGAQNNVPLEIRKKMKEGVFNPKKTVNIALSYLVYEKVNPIGDMSGYIDEIGHRGVYKLFFTGYLTNKDIRIYENENLYMFETEDGRAVRIFHHVDSFSHMQKGESVVLECRIKKHYRFKREPITVMDDVELVEW